MYMLVLLKVWTTQTYNLLNWGQDLWCLILCHCDLNNWLLRISWRNLVQLVSCLWVDLGCDWWHLNCLHGLVADGWTWGVKFIFQMHHFYVWVNSIKIYFQRWIFQSKDTYEIHKFTHYDGDKINTYLCCSSVFDQWVLNS